MSGDQGLGAAEGRQLPGPGQPERRGEAPLPDGPAVKGRSTPAKFPAQFPASGECTSHLGLGLVLSHGRNYRVEAMEFSPGILGGEAPVDDWTSLRSCSRALTSRQRVSSSGSLCLRQLREMTLNSISAIFSQLPCLDVW